jgi:hypothetical protein
MAREQLPLGVGAKICCAGATGVWPVAASVNLLEGRLEIAEWIWPTLTDLSQGLLPTLDHTLQKRGKIVR